jgi:hypothetical protein
MIISETQEIEDKIQIWKQRLAGDSNSNPLVDFRKNKKPVVDIITDASFLYKKFAEDEANSLSTSELQTKQTGTDLIKLLDDLCKDAKSSIEEKGFNSLFLVFGILTWFDPVKPQERYVSPILLVPVRLEKKGTKAPEFTLSSTDEDISVNFLLVNKLYREFNIELPDSENAQKLDYKSFFDAVRSAIAKHPEWEIEETARITLFQDAKAAMIQDLEQNQERIVNHPILKELALKRTPENVSKPPIPQEKELDGIDPNTARLRKNRGKIRKKVFS